MDVVMRERQCLGEAADAVHEVEGDTAELWVARERGDEAAHRIRVTVAGESKQPARRQRHRDVEPSRASIAAIPILQRRFLVHEQLPQLYGLPRVGKAATSGELQPRCSGVLRRRVRALLALVITNGSCDVVMETALVRVSAGDDLRQRIDLVFDAWLLLGEQSCK